MQGLVGYLWVAEESFGEPKLRFGFSENPNDLDPWTNEKISRDPPHAA